MGVSANLALPYIEAAQAQKHVTHNEALRALDALVHISIVDRDLVAPPATPVEGARYVIASSPTGAWTGQAGKIGAWQDGAWAFFAPKAGWVLWIEDENTILVFDGSGFSAPMAEANITAALTSANLDNIGRVGVAASADATNRLTVASPASLFTHDGAGHQQKINKNSASDSASQLYQTGFAGRAEIGLLGDDDFSFNVSADGSTFNTALKFDKTTACAHVRPGAEASPSIAFQGDANTGIWSPGADAIAISSGGAERVRITATGDVGIGASAPSTKLHVNGAIRCGQFTVGALPGASSTGAGAIIFVSDESGGACLAFSDGANWRRVTDRAVVS